MSLCWHPEDDCPTVVTSKQNTQIPAKGHVMEMPLLMDCAPMCERQTLKCSPHIINACSQNRGIRTLYSSVLLPAFRRPYLQPKPSDMVSRHLHLAGKNTAEFIRTDKRTHILSLVWWAWSEQRHKIRFFAHQAESTITSRNGHEEFWSHMLAIMDSHQFHNY